ncbi:MAG: patatin-like phospholipase family protein [Gammaproteobacteria bacterium]|nr:patatin-like phospholipase family protein [Gammaproteobacteria bacterium]
MLKNNFSRRRFLNLLSIFLPASLLWSPSRADQQQNTGNRSIKKNNSGTPSIGIALGAGGANGLAHILMLEVLDEMDITPKQISGSSIGAIIGALYASGLSGNEIRELVEQFIISPDEELLDEFSDQETFRWLDFIDVEFGKGGLLNSKGFISFLYDELKQKKFKQLKIPLKVIAGDLWKREQIVLQSGNLLPAIEASMALPGIFQPVVVNDRVLVDGGTVNPVPYDLLMDECDIVIAIDVDGIRTKPENLIPGYLDTVFNSIKVMQRAIMTEKLRQQRPHIYISPHISNIRALEFYRASEVFEQAQPAREELKRQLSKVLKA